MMAMQYYSVASRGAVHDSQSSQQLHRAQSHSSSPMTSHLPTDHEDVKLACLAQADVTGRQALQSDAVQVLEPLQVQGQIIALGALQDEGLQVLQQRQHCGESRIGGPGKTNLQVDQVKQWRRDVGNGGAEDLQRRCLEEQKTSC